MVTFDHITHTGSSKGCILFLGNSDRNSDCHDNMYVLMGNHKANSFDNLYVAMADGPLHMVCHSYPWGQIWLRPGVDSLHRLTTGKPSNTLSPKPVG